ncbi:MAG TPA: sigma-70 family RNA polymerase sigma factor [Streptosporangiaceae bacterium]
MSDSVRDERYPSWDDVYRDNVERIYRVLFARVGNRPDAEDLTGEVFVAALPRLRTTASVREVRAYLLAVARTVLAEHWRRTLGRQLTAIDPDTLAEALTVADDAADAARVTAVQQILDELPERYGTILRLRFLQAATVKEAAKQMGVTVANAKVLQYRALRHAARLLEVEAR